MILGATQWNIELTLTNRDVMGFRMLLGRQAIRRKFVVDVDQSFLQSQVAKDLEKKHHQEEKR